MRGMRQSPGGHGAPAGGGTADGRRGRCTRGDGAPAAAGAPVRGSCIPAGAVCQGERDGTHDLFEAMCLLKVNHTQRIAQELLNQRAIKTKVASSLRA